MAVWEQVLWAMFVFFGSLAALLLAWVFLWPSMRDEAGEREEQ